MLFVRAQPNFPHGFSSLNSDGYSPIYKSAELRGWLNPIRVENNVEENENNSHLDFIKNERKFLVWHLLDYARV
jgi:hypothetical protein